MWADRELPAAAHDRRGARRPLLQGGPILIFCIGVNLIRPKTFRVANMLPAVIVAIAVAFIS